MPKKTVKKSTPKRSGMSKTPVSEIRTEKGNSGLTPTFPDRPIGYGNPPRETQIKPGEAKNPGGRPRSLSGAYKKMLETVNEKDPLGRTNAELMAEAAKINGMKGDVSMLRELRSATEGERTRTIEDDIIDYLREGKLTPAQVREALGDDANRLIAAAGLAGTTDTPTSEAQAPSGASPDPGSGGG